MTHEQLETFCAKCGILLPDPRTGRARIKIYTDEQGRVKGDALATYALRPSVLNAVEILDGALLREGGPPVRVAEASFDHKQARTQLSADVSQARVQSTADAAPRLSVRDFVQEKMSWEDDDDNADKKNQSSASRIVILKNVFEPDKADYQVISEDMQEGCEQIGDVDKITVFEGNEHGVVAVKFGSIQSCLRCIQVMNGRWYDGRQLSAQFYDGHTDYRHKESDADREERERNWKEWLESDSHNKPNSQLN